MNKHKAGDTVTIIAGARKGTKAVVRHVNQSLYSHSISYDLRIVGVVAISRYYQDEVAR